MRQRRPIRSSAASTRAAGSSVIGPTQTACSIGPSVPAVENPARPCCASQCGLPPLRAVAAPRRRLPGIAILELDFDFADRDDGIPLQARISQQAPSGAQAQVGNTLPDSRSAQKLPNNVTDQVPDGKGLLFQVAGPDHFDRSGHQAGDRDYHGCDHHGFESEQFQQAFPRAAGRDRTSASMRWIAACPRTAKVTS